MVGGYLIDKVGKRRIVIIGCSMIVVSLFVNSVLYYVHNAYPYLIF